MALEVTLGMDLGLENGTLVGFSLVAEDGAKLGKILGSLDDKVLGDSVPVISPLVLSGLADGLVLELPDCVGLFTTGCAGDDDAQSVGAVTLLSLIPSPGSLASFICTC